MSFWRGELLKLIADLKQRQPLNANLTSWAAIARAAGFDAFAAIASSANLRALLNDETGTGAAVFAGAPTITGIPVFTGIPSLTGGALSFPTTQVPSAGANDLDDYEEGNFTPVVAGLTTAGAGTYSTQTGRYTKIGNIVCYAITLTWTAHTGTGNMQIQGLPFTAAQNTPSVLWVQNLTFAGAIQSRVQNGTTNLSVETVTSGNPSASLAIDTAASISANGLYFT